MLVFALVKGVPANTTRVVSVGGILRREEMDIVLNPYDRKTIEAADYMRRRVGGKLIALSMGPHPKIIPIMNELFDAEISGIDEAYILSDKRMAGSDTWATSYTLSKGISKILSIHREAIEILAKAVDAGESIERVEALAADLYRRNLLPNKIYSDKPSIRETLINMLSEGKISREEASKILWEEANKIYRGFMIFAGMKTSDGETGNVGPQVAEALSQELGFSIPHVSFVLDFEYIGERNSIVARRKLVNLIQVVEVKIPAVLTIHVEYSAPPIPLSGRRWSLLNSYRGKNRDIKIYNADDIKADPRFIGLAGSPTVVGPGVDIGRPYVRKVVGSSLIAAKDIDKVSYGDKTYGPYKKGDLLDSLPEEIKRDLMSKGLAKIFDYDDLAEEIINALRG
jgi:electron transfer flavoprotein beta subunit